MEKAIVVVREAKPEDKDVIIKSWLMGNYWGNWHYNQMDQDEYFKAYIEHIASILSKPNIRADVAVLSDATDMVLGYVVYRGPIIFWSYTKPDYRLKGVFNLLTKDKGFTIATGVTKPGCAIAKRKHIKINPLVT